jgi:hypothetical protein
MQPTVWRDVMFAYHNAKFSAIPLTEKRTPYDKDWSKWNRELPEECLYRPQQSGVGILPGPESGVMFVDIDTEDPELLRILKSIIPTSPVQRFGSKGVGIAYAYNEKISSRKFQSIRVEIFADSGYVVVPPSYHDKTGGHYKWLGPSLLDFPREDLPVFGADVIQVLETLDTEFKKYQESNGIQKEDRGGRHNTLLAQAFAALHKGKDIDEIAKELAEYDLKKHKISWFKEEMRAKSDDDVLAKAKKFAAGALKTFEKKNPVVLEEGHHEPREIEKFEIRNYPKAKGVINEIATLIEESSYTKVPNMAFGSALAIFSTLIGNNYSFEGVAGNVFCLLLADSGTGKKFGVDVAKNLLADHDLIGSANYVSSGAIVSNLTDFIVKLDTSDEFSKTLKIMKNGGVWQQSMPQELCDLWSASTGKMVNSIAKKGEQKTQALIYRPYISILAATTVSEFKASVDRSLFTSGLLPRCLFFMDSATGESRPRLDLDRVNCMETALKEFTRLWLMQHPRDVITNAPGDRKVFVEDKSLAFFDQKMNEFHRQMFSAQEGSPEKIMLTRKREFYKKLALLHYLSRACGVGSIERQDLDWAEAVFDTSFHNQTAFIGEAAAENLQHSIKERVFGIIRDGHYLTHNELTRKTQFLAEKQRNAITQDLLGSNRIKYDLKSAKNGKMVKYYYVSGGETLD